MLKSFFWFAYEGAGGDAADWLIDIYSGNTKGWLPGHLALTHNDYHIGHVAVICGRHSLKNSC